MKIKTIENFLLKEEIDKIKEHPEINEDEIQRIRMMLTIGLDQILEHQMNEVNNENN